MQKEKKGEKKKRQGSLNTAIIRDSSVVWGGKKKSVSAHICVRGGYDCELCETTWWKQSDGGEIILMMCHQCRVGGVIVFAFKKGVCVCVCVNTCIKLNTRHQTDSQTSPEATELVGCCCCCCCCCCSTAPGPNICCFQEGTYCWPFTH